MSEPTPAPTNTDQRVEYVPDCGQCRACMYHHLPEPTGDWATDMMRTQRFIVCSECGNKRCPHAADHRLACTGSNEPNQPGSDYQQRYFGDEPGTPGAGRGLNEQV